MNSNIVATCPFLAAAAASVVLPISPIAAGFIVTVIGVLSVLVLDYGCPGVREAAHARCGSGPRQLAGFRAPEKVQFEIRGAESGPAPAIHAPGRATASAPMVDSAQAPHGLLAGGGPAPGARRKVDGLIRVGLITLESTRSHAHHRIPLLTLPVGVCRGPSCARHRTGARRRSQGPCA